MIHLFERFNQQTKALYESMLEAGHNALTIVLQDDGFLPKAVTSPYRFFAENEITPNDQARFFNEIEVPPYWSINGDNNEAWIKDMGEVRGHIHYHPSFGHRMVQSVDWLNPAGQVRYTDHYDRFGLRYAQTTYDLRGVAIFKQYFTKAGEPLIYHNYITQNIMLTWQGKDYLFHNQADWLRFYIHEMGVSHEQFVINHLGTSLTLLYHLEEAGHDYVVWQEHVSETGDLPGNMNLLLNVHQQNQSKRDFTLIVPDHEEYQRIISRLDDSVKHKVKQGGYVYPVATHKASPDHVLTLTNSDQIEHLESIVKASPTLTFHVAAITEMSARLMRLGQYDNVKLYPTATKATIDQLYQTCGIYLDINSGNEILNAVQRAFITHMLILAYEETRHNKTYTAPQNMFKSVDYQDFINALHEVRNKVKWQARLTAQYSHANAIDKQTFNALFNEES